MGQALEVNYFRGKNYLEVIFDFQGQTNWFWLLENSRFDFWILQLDIDVGSSTVARGVVNLVLGYLNNLIVEMAFLIQVKLMQYDILIETMYIWFTAHMLYYTDCRLTLKMSYQNHLSGHVGWITWIRLSRYLWNPLKNRLIIIIIIIRCRWGDVLSRANKCIYHVKLIFFWWLVVVDTWIICTHKEKCFWVRFVSNHH